MKGLLSGALALAASFPVAAASDQELQKCAATRDDARRLACYDSLLKTAPAPAEQPPAATHAASANVASTPSAVETAAVRLSIRQSGDFNNFAGASTVDQPTQLSVVHNNGKDATVAKLAAIVTSDKLTFNALGWQPFAAFAWKRDTTGAKPLDLRDASLGAAGPLWNIIPSGWTIFASAKATHRTDLYGAASANQLRLHADIVKLSWINSAPGDARNSFTFVPQFGYLQDDRTDTGPDHGHWGSAYAVLHADAQLNAWLPRLSTTVDYERFTDRSVPVGNVRRDVGHTVMSISYALTDPKLTTGLRPSISLTREVGVDVLGGGSRVNKTSLNFGFKFDS